MTWNCCKIPECSQFIEENMICVKAFFKVRELNPQFIFNKLIKIQKNLSFNNVFDLTYNF